MATIYRWRNKINGKGYTGKTERDLPVRDKQRWRDKRDSKSLKDAMAKYGKENFTCEIIEDGITDPEYLKEREMYWISHFGDFHNGYNQTEGGEGWTSETVSGEKHPFYGKKLSVEHRQNISEALKGKRRPTEICQKISETKKGKNYGRTGENASMYGKRHSAETCQKMSEAKRGAKNPRYGKRHSAEACQKMSETKKRPEYAQARWFFFVLLMPMNMDITEKRKQFFKAFEQIPYKTLYEWFRKWQIELEIT